MTRYLSICSGLEGASLAVGGLGWSAVGFAEIEAFPAAVIAQRYGSNLPGEPLIPVADSFELKIAVSTGHTRIPWRGKVAEACPDGPRYKELGNSWAVPVVAWIAACLDAGLRAS